MPIAPRSSYFTLPFACLFPFATYAAQRAAPVRSVEASAAISDIAYTVSFDESIAPSRTIKMSMSFSAASTAPVVLSLPAWTPGAYELSYFAKWVSNFTPTGDGKPLEWDKADHDTWRIRPKGARRITVTFDYRSDSLDNAMAWSSANFLFFNGTNVFMYPEGRSFDFPATVSVRTASSWLVATGMTPGNAPRTYTASNYHELVDMPFFVGRFDLDSMRIADTWVRLATYPVGSVAAAARKEIWDQLSRVIPPQVAVFGETPFRTYTVMQIADSSFGGASGLEHQNSHVDVISPLAIGNPFMASLYAHEIFHAWNVKRLRPAALWPYQYANEQPTEWLWVSEGITDYYADLAEVRGGVVDSAGFFALTSGKIEEVSAVTPVALEDASLSTWVHPTDGTAYLYYPKGSLAGLMLDIMVRDASGNRKSLDDVMRTLYQSAYKSGRGFTAEEWWRTVSQAAGGKSFDEFNAKYIDGRDAYPWAQVLPLAGMLLKADTVREPAQLGLNAVTDDKGVLVTGVETGSVAAEADVRTGDYLLAIGDIAVSDPSFNDKFRTRFKTQGAPVTVRVRRGAELLALTGKIRLGERYDIRMEADPNASAKAASIRNGILKGTVTR
ncbi:MAG: PDZ domain-containing protein [Gemmatimonadota bacterium]|nr:PDZ domain-containing protein [Gemmatimonadota bacterium]